jgi:N-hydroxyarylamine O-acetyltransferase
MPEVDLDGYFARIGYDGPRVASVEVLRRLQALHPGAIPFENLDVLTDRGVSLEPADVEAKLIARRRGGYCYEQNGLFKRVLQALGFTVEALACRVVWNAPPDAPMRPRTHLALRVQAEGETWLCDVGFGGCVLLVPLRWVFDTPQETPHERFRLREEGDEIVQEAEREGVWLPTYRIGRERVEEVDYLLPNWWTSTHPSSHFRHLLVVSRATPDARFNLLNNRLTVRRPDGSSEPVMLDVVGLDRTLAEVFGLPVDPEWRPYLERAVEAGAN